MSRIPKEEVEVVRERITRILSDAGIDTYEFMETAPKVYTLKAHPDVPEVVLNQIQTALPFPFKVQSATWANATPTALVEAAGAPKLAEAINSDPVHHPSHYTVGRIEVIDFIEDQGFDFHLGNVVKYLARAGKKDPDKKFEDLKKARWYLDRAISKEPVQAAINMCGAV